MCAFVLPVVYYHIRCVDIVNHFTDQDFGSVRQLESKDISASNVYCLLNSPVETFGFVQDSGTGGLISNGFVSLCA